MTKHLLAAVTAVGFTASAALAQLYVPMSPPPAVPPYFGLPGSRIIAPPASPITDHTKKVTDPDGGTPTTRSKTATKQE